MSTSTETRPVPFRTLSPAARDALAAAGVVGAPCRCGAPLTAGSPDEDPRPTCADECGSDPRWMELHDIAASSDRGPTYLDGAVVLVRLGERSGCLSLDAADACADAFTRAAERYAAAEYRPNRQQITDSARVALDGGRLRLAEGLARHVLTHT